MTPGNQTVFVICEYNPFHFGHGFQLSLLRENFSTVVCVMSGNTVQRGCIAGWDKYLRAAAAINGGADLVVELPFPFSMLSARDFAFSAVSLCGLLGAKHLAFGAESPRDVLNALLPFVSDPSEAKLLIKENPSLSFPKAVSRLVRRSLGESLAAELSKPNNILALEYLSAVSFTGFDITPHVIKREECYISSGCIRHRLLNGEPLESLVLPGTKELLSGNIRETGLLYPLIQYRLLAKNLPDVYGIDNGRLKRLALLSRSFGTMTELVEACTDGTHTKARIRRALMSLLLGVSPSDARTVPEYTVLLAANQAGRRYLKENKKNIPIPVVTKPADCFLTSFQRELEAERIIGIPFGGDDPISKSPYITDR